MNTATETDWWEEHRVDEQTQVVFAPAQHSSGRTPWARQRSLWGSFLVIHGELSVYFAGDTAYQKHFDSIRQRYGPVDLALLPIGGYKPRKLHQSVHMDPVDAVHAHDDLQARYSIGIHHGTFQLSAESFEEPVDELSNYLISQGRSAGEFLFNTEGMTLQFDTVGSTIELINTPGR